MTWQPTTYQIPRPALSRDWPAVTPPRAPKLPARQCPRCGAIRTHYLTCPSLRLPPDYRLSQDPGPERADHRGQHRITRRPSLVPGWHRQRPPGGPDHADWPYPPQH
jgi:hypothetical protein